MAASSEPLPPTDLLLARAWPEGVPAAEVELLARLPLGRRKKVLRRLAALTAPGPMSERAGVAGDTRTTFFRVRQAWSLNRSLSSLTPYLDHAPNRRRSYPEAEIRASREVRLDPGATTETIVGRVRDAVADAPGLSTMRRIVADAQRAAASARMSADGFGRDFCIEYVLTDLPTLVGAGAERMYLALLFEMPTGLILGWRVGCAYEASHLVTGAALEDVDGLRSRLPDVDRSTPPRLLVRLPPAGSDPAEPRLTLIANASRALGKDHLLADRTDYGSLMAGTIGFRLGDLRLLPRRTADLRKRLIPAEEAEGLPLLDAAGAEYRVRTAVKGHNARLAAYLSDIGALGRPGGAGGPLKELTRWARYSPPGGPAEGG